MHDQTSASDCRTSANSINGTNKGPDELSEAGIMDELDNPNARRTDKSHLRRLRRFEIRKHVCTRLTSPTRGAFVATPRAEPPPASAPSSSIPTTLYTLLHFFARTTELLPFDGQGSTAA